MLTPMATMLVGRVPARYRTLTFSPNMAAMRANGSSQFIGTTYAPNAAFTFSGSSGACGALHGQHHHTQWRRGDSI